MKKILFTLQLLLISSFIFAQNKPQKNDFGIGIDYKLQREVHILSSSFDDWGGYGFDYRIESFNFFPALKFDYYLKDDMSLNLFFRPSFAKKSETNERLSNYKNFNESNIARFSMDIGVGYEYHFFKKLKIDPFIGINAHYLYSGKEKIKTASKYYDYQDGNLRSQNNRDTKGVETHGLYSTANFGLNYFVSRNFSLGLNLDLGYRYSIQNGTAFSNYERLNYDEFGLLFETIKTEDETRLKNINSGFIYSFSVKTAFYFPLKKKEK